MMAENGNMTNMTETGYEDYYGDYGNGTTFCDQDSGPDLSNLSILCYVLFCLGLLGNALVLWVLLRHMKMKTMTDICLLNLSLSDLTLAVTLPLWPHNSQNLATCKVMTGIYQLGFYSGTLFVTLMSVDRYLAIVHAVAAMRARTLCYGIIASVSIWVTAVLMAIPQVIFADLEDLEDNSSECQPLYPEDAKQFWMMRRNFTENTVGLFVCLPIMIFCYVNILMVLSKCRNSKKGRAIKLIFSIVCLFVVCWVPYNVTVFLQTLQLLKILDTCDISRGLQTAMFIAELIALSHCCVNPIVYAFVGEKFRKSLDQVFKRYICWRYRGRSPLSVKDTTEGETSNTPVKSDH